MSTTHPEVQIHTKQSRIDNSHNSNTSSSNGTLKDLSKLKWRSWQLTGTLVGTDGSDVNEYTVKRSGARAFMRAVNWKDQDFKKPIIGVCCPVSGTYSPCNAHFDQLSDYIKNEIESYGGRAIVFSTPTINDGMTMGTEGMRYSLPSRDLIADSIETMYEGYYCDALFTVGGCDKTQPVCI
jgi:dihydroxyacid dehydratase/phosphogluconate dehydratase